MDFKKILSDFGSYIFIGLTLLGFLIIYAGVGGRSRRNYVGETNFYFIGIGLILIMPFIIWTIKNKLKSKQIQDDEASEIRKLISCGDKITINLDLLEIQTNNYRQEVSVGHGTQQRNEYVDVNHNVILLEVPYKDELIKYKLNIDMDSTKLKMHFAIKETTELYVDPENSNNNYLDLRFLEG
ncbi:hypothetical protein VOI54_17935 [Tamlana sp. 2201CG12-4]|uniref:hypothetical protein n=1 Tax=Tamlana sp. 2201CG12-4 TaxID=3112582 RepID=UPI002DC01585|nr:hypothetical protein [Tamlana sp. 2201CG12-4]MEC3908908.1 hypothetical protein [Tamlana sp. 2201CG12-4]